MLSILIEMRRPYTIGPRNTAHLKKTTKPNRRKLERLRDEKTKEGKESAGKIEIVSDAAVRGNSTSIDNLKPQK